jgi:hypothetical protein
VFEDLENRLKVVSGASKAMVLDRETGNAAFASKKHQHLVGTGSAAVAPLPLKIEGVYPIAPSLRYSSVLPPLPCTGGGDNSNNSTSSAATSKLIEPLEVVVRFERSNAWPDSLRALRAAKTAFLLQICRALEAYSPAGSASSSSSGNDHHGKSKKKRGRDGGNSSSADSSSSSSSAASSGSNGSIECFPSECHADVCLQGFVFRLRIVVDKEASLVPFFTPPKPSILSAPLSHHDPALDGDDYQQDGLMLATKDNNNNNQGGESGGGEKWATVGVSAKKLKKQRQYEKRVAGAGGGGSGGAAAAAVTAAANAADDLKRKALLSLRKTVVSTDPLTAAGLGEEPPSVSERKPLQFPL